MKKRSSLVKVGLLLLILSLIITGCGDKQATGNTDKPVQWIANTAYPPNNHNSIGLVDFAERLKEATEGKVELTIQTVGP